MMAVGGGGGVAKWIQGFIQYCSYFHLYFHFLIQVEKLVLKHRDSFGKEKFQK